MGEEFIKELRELLSGSFTGTVTLHCCDGAVKQVETNRRWRPKADGGRVDLTEEKAR